MRKVRIDEEADISAAGLQKTDIFTRKTHIALI